MDYVIMDARMPALIRTMYILSASICTESNNLSGHVRKKRARDKETDPLVRRRDHVLSRRHGTPSRQCQ